MRRAGKYAILTYDDIIEGLLTGLSLHLPEGVTDLMLKADAIEQLNEDLGYTDPDTDEETEVTL